MKATFLLIFFLPIVGLTQNDHDPAELDPCQGNTHGLVMHFIKYSDTIFETTCDSIIHLANYILSDTTTSYYLIGIAPDKSPEEKFNARHRAETLKKELIKYGIKPDRLLVTIAIHAKPQKGKPRDWPYYPIHYKYEIGVYLEKNYD